MRDFGVGPRIDDIIEAILKKEPNVGRDGRSAPLWIPHAKKPGDLYVVLTDLSHGKFSLASECDGLKPLVSNTPLKQRAGKTSLRVRHAMWVLLPLKLPSWSWDLPFPQPLTSGHSVVLWVLLLFESKQLRH